MCDFHVKKNGEEMYVVIQIEHQGTVRATVPSAKIEDLMRLKTDVSNCRLDRVQVINRLLELGAKIG